jgi:hypothetical protein
MRIFDLDGNIIGIVEQYDKCSVTHDFYAQSMITLDVNKNAPYVELLAYPNIIEYDNYGKKSYFILEDTKYSQRANIENLTLFGRTYGLFDQRLILGLDEKEDNAETVMKYYVGLLTSPRDIPNLIIQEDSKLGSILKYPGNNQYVSQMLEAVCWQSSLGWDVVLENRQYVFKVSQGVDRTVKFKKEFGNIQDVDWELMLSKSKTVAYVGDENSGSARDFTIVGTASGINRREIFVNGRNTDGDGRESSGDKILEQYKAERSITCQYNYIEPFLYNRDFFLGDRVTFVGDDFSLNAQIIQVNELVHKSGTTVQLVLNKQTATLVDLIKSDMTNLSVEARL